MNSKKYQILSKFDYEYHDGHSVKQASAGTEAIVETMKNQVYVVQNDERIHTTMYPWTILKTVSAGILKEIV